MSCGGAAVLAMLCDGEAAECLCSSHGEPREEARRRVVLVSVLPAAERPSLASGPPPGVTFRRCPPGSGGGPRSSEAPLPRFFL